MAGQIPPQFIDELLARVDIVDIIDMRVPLKKTGKNLQACCPFHNEKTPSFTVSPDKQFYHCFGCGAHGSAIGFLMEYDQFSFVEAVQELADQLGMTVPTTKQVSQTPFKQHLYDLMDKVCQFYVHQLTHHSQRQLFQDYLNKRGLSRKTIARFDLGMAPEGWDNLLKTFGQTQQGSKQLLDAGLLVKNDKGRLYDRFRQRLMFPIRDRRGRVIGFGGRVLDDSTPKYLNSPETAVFHKGAELYGLFQVRKANRRLEHILIVEGYMDAIALAEHDINNAVATLGTSTTQEHLRQLFRAAPEVVFCFDGDRAGREAAWRAAENALPMLGGNQQIKFMFLPEGEDPDTLVRKAGAEVFQQQVKAAQNYSDFFFDTLSRDLDLSAMDGRARMVELVKPYLKQVPAGIYRDMMEQRLAELSQTSTNALKKHLQRPKIKTTKTGKAVKATANMTPVRYAITIVLQYPQLAQQLDQVVDFRPLQTAGIDLLMELLETIQQNPNLTAAGLLERYRDTSHAKHLQKLTVQPLILSEQALFYELQGVIDGLRRQLQERRIEELASKPVSELTEAEKAEVKSFK